MKNYDYYILHGLAELEMPNYITPAITTTRGNSIKFVQPSAQVDPYKFSFFPQSINLWNKLQIDNILLPSMTCSNTLIEHTSYTKYSNRTVISTVRITECSDDRGSDN